MGIDVIRLNSGNDAGATPAPAQREQDLVRPVFARRGLPPAMSIWMMTIQAGKNVFPWWSYGSAWDEDINKLASLSGIKSAQGLFDFLFLLQLKKQFPTGLYAIAPGNIKTEGWTGLSETARAAYDRGQSCVYRLEASLGKKLSINWVPFFQPQALIKDPTADNLNRFFGAAKTDDVANSISFFSLADVRRLPEVTTLLVQADDKRSEKLAQLVDWFGVFSSPRNDAHGTCALAYSANATALNAFTAFETSLTASLEQVRKALLAEPAPLTVLRLLSRLVVL